MTPKPAQSGARGRTGQTIPCDDVLVAVGQENAFPWIERDCGIEFDKWNMPQVDAKTFASTNPKCSSAAMRHSAENIIWRWRTAMMPHFRSTRCAPAKTSPSARFRSACLVAEDGHPRVELRQRHLRRQALQVPHRDKVIALRTSARGRTRLRRQARARRGATLPELRHPDRVLAPACIECDACVDICPMDCITFTENGEEKICGAVESPSPHHDQALYVADG